MAASASSETHLPAGDNTTPAVGVAVENLSKKFGAFEVLKGVTFSVAPGEIFVLMGPSGSGKSVLLKHVVGLEQPTAGRVTVDGRETRVNFWDLAGGAEYADVRNEMYKDAQGVMLVYDVGNARSFQALDGWLREAAKFGAKDLVTVVCANKVDAGKRAVSEAEGRKWATSRGFAYFETSASTGQNVTPMFEQLFADIVLLRAPK